MIEELLVGMEIENYESNFEEERYEAVKK